MLLYSLKLQCVLSKKNILLYNHHTVIKFRESNVDYNTLISSSYFKCVNCSNNALYNII